MKLLGSLATMLTCCAALIITSQGHCQNKTIIGNLNTNTLFSGVEIDTQWQRAAGFTMGADDYDLLEISLNISQLDGVSLAAVLDVGLYSNSVNDNPETLLVRFEPKTTTGQPGLFRQITLVPDSSPFRSFRLRAFTSYWLVVRAHGNGTYWSYPVGPHTDPEGVATWLGGRTNQGQGGLPTFSVAEWWPRFDIQGAPANARAWYLQNPANGQIGRAEHNKYHFTNWRTFPQVVGSAWEVLTFGNFGGTADGDAFLRNKASGSLAFWYAHGENFYQFVGIPQMPPAIWQFQGSAKFGGSLDFPVYQNPQSGVVVVGAHNGQQITQWRIFPKVPNPAWEIVAIGDTNQDQYADVIFRSKATGQLAIWRTDGFDFTSWHVLPQVPSSIWEILGVHQEGSTMTGVIFQNKATKEYAIWRLNAGGTAFQYWMPIRIPPPSNFVFKGDSA